MTLKMHIFATFEYFGVMASQRASRSACVCISVTLDSHSHAHKMHLYFALFMSILHILINSSLLARLYDQLGLFFPSREKANELEIILLTTNMYVYVCTCVAAPQKKFLMSGVTSFTHSLTWRSGRSNVELDTSVER